MNNDFFYLRKVRLKKENVFNAQKEGIQSNVRHMCQIDIDKNVNTLKSVLSIIPESWNKQIYWEIFPVGRMCKGQVREKTCAYYNNCK